MNQRIKTASILIICTVLLSAGLSVGTEALESNGILDISNLFNYENQFRHENSLYRLNEENPITDMGATLGRVLFYDKKLSVNNSTSCASCHQQENAFGDSRVVATGFEGRPTLRHPMRLVNVDFGSDANRFWDERVRTLENLATLPIQDTIEMGFSGTNGYPGMDSLINKLSKEEYYKTLFSLTFGDEEITEEKIAKALAQFIRSIFVFDSKFDEGYKITENEKTEFPNFTAQENRGKSMFFTFPGGDPSFPQTFGTGCALCHRAPDFTIIHLSGNNGVVGVAGDSTAMDISIERSPSLKSIIKPDGTSNGPFMHDGSLKTIDEIIEHYNDVPHNPANTNLGGLMFPNPDGSVSLNLSDESKADLKAFLLTLGGTDVYTNEKWSNPFDIDGNITLVNDPNCTNIESFISISLCEGDEYDGYSQEGIYQDTFSLTPICDSIRTLELTVFDQVSSSSVAEICEGDEYEGYTMSGEYTINLTSVNGCDSIHTVSLTVHPVLFTSESINICEGEDYMGITESGEYPFFGLSTIGCDSIHTVQLTVLEATDPACAPSSISELIKPSFALSQNLSTDKIFGTVELNGDYNFQILNSRGKTIMNDRQMINESFEINIEKLVPGIYYLHSKHRQYNWTKRFVKI